MRYRLVLLICLLCGFTFVANCSATVMSYDFNAAFSFSTTTYYGASIPTSTPISGKFEIDSQVTGVHPGGNPNVSIYTQVIPDGVKFTVGSLDIRASEYQVVVSNNVPSASLGIVDLVNIRWASDVVPALAPIKVNGVAKTSGMFSINLTVNQSLFSDTSLPNNLDFSNFLSSLSFLSDVPKGSALLYSLNSLTSQEVQLEIPVAPEPNSFLSLFLLLLLGRSFFTVRLGSPSSSVRL